MSALVSRICSVYQRINHWVKEWADEPMNQRIIESMIQWINESMNEGMDE